jgi:hypothetical protein
MKPLYQPPSGVLGVPYAPTLDTKILENPPRFTWMPAQLDGDRYVLQISADTAFDTAFSAPITYEPIPYNLFTPDAPLDPGTYYWRYALLDEHGARSEWSEVRAFTIPADVPITPLPSRESRYESAIMTHPRLWLDASAIDEFRGYIRQDGTFCGWDVFYEKSAEPWMQRDLIPEPAPYPNGVRTAPLWRQMYIDCQEALYAVRHLSVAGVIAEDEPMIARAKEWLLHITRWDVNGTTSRDYNDEAAFRIVGALAWGYDWLYNHLSDDERAEVRASLFARTEQVAHHVIERSKIHHVPYDSHAVRSLSSVLVPCCIALLGEDHNKPQEWLDYTLEYYACLYSPWGGEDGGWAEGPMYWTTGMAYLIDALNLIRNTIGIDFYQRPFFQKTGDFPLYCYSPDTARASFGDQSNLGERPGLKTAFNIRQFAGVTGSGLYQWYFERVREWDTDAQKKFFNYGWWDFAFDDMLYRHDNPIVQPVPPTDVQPVKWFRDIGWVAFHHRMDDPDEHVMLLTKSSPYGSLSHSHGDQNAFVLHAYGEPLAIESGYYIAFGSTIHRNWRRQTRSKNALLIDGLGQYAGVDKVLTKLAQGRVEEVRSDPNMGYVRMNATDAYREHVPYVEHCIRELVFVDNTYFVMIDHVGLAQAGRVDWLMHCLYEPTVRGQGFTVAGERADLSVQFVFSSSGDLTLNYHNQFTEVDPAEVQGLPCHYHVNATTQAHKQHRIVTVLHPRKKGDNSYVSFFMDDQGHGLHLYFTHNGSTRRIPLVPRS